MASQVAHIIYAQKYFEKFPSPMDKDEFMLGCVFPDIRRIDANIKRKDTHLILEDINLDFAYLAPFQAGWKFHIYCDMKRTEILNKYNFFDFEETGSFDDSASKLLEDELIYNECNNWEKLTNYFNNPPVIEAGIGVSRETFELWYAILGNYIGQKPDSQRISFFLSKLPGLVEKSREIVSAIDKLRQNDKVVEILKKVAEEIV